MSFYLGLPQILFLAITFLGTGIYLAKHGEPKQGTYNFYIAVLSDIIILTLLCWGGFFTAR